MLKRIRQAWNDSKPTRLVLVSVLFTVLAVYITLTARAEGDSADMWRGIAILLFFGPLSLVALGMRFPSVAIPALSMLTPDAGRSSIEVHEIQHHGRSQQAIVFKPESNSSVILLGIAVFGAWAISLVLFALVGSRSRLGSVGLLFIVLCCVVLIVVGGAVMARDGPALIVLSEGVLCRTTQGSSFVPWSVLTDATVSQYTGQQIIGLTVTDIALVEQAPWTRLYNSFNKRFVEFDIVLPATGGDEAVVEQITATVRRIATHSEERVPIEQLSASLSKRLNVRID